MASFDSVNKRISALNTAMFKVLPFADGEIGIDDRQILLFQYAFETFVSAITKVLIVGNRILIEKYSISERLLDEKYVDSNRILIEKYVMGDRSLDN